MHSPIMMMGDLSHGQHPQMQQCSQQHTPNSKSNIQQHLFGSGVWMSTPPGMLGGFGTPPRVGTGGSNGINGVHQSGDTDLLALLTSSHFDQPYELGGLYSPDVPCFTGGRTDILAGLNGGASGMQMANGTANTRTP